MNRYAETDAVPPSHRRSTKGRAMVLRRATYIATISVLIGHATGCAHQASSRSQERIFSEAEVAACSTHPAQQLRAVNLVRAEKEHPTTANHRFLHQTLQQEKLIQETRIPIDDQYPDGTFVRRRAAIHAVR